ncbi:RE2, partial [Symbiodinium pilosum]
SKTGLLQQCKDQAVTVTPLNAASVDLSTTYVPDAISALEERGAMHFATFEPSDASWQNVTTPRPEPQAPSWCTNMQAAFGQIQASRAQASASSTESTFPRISEPPPVPEAFRRLGAIQSQQQRSAPAAFQVPPSAQLTGQVEVPPFSLPSPPVGHTLPATPAISGTELPSSVGVFAQVHALRSAHRRERRASDAQASSQTTSAGSPQPFRGHVASCTICLSEYTAGDQVCRLSCGHIFHALCIGEHCQHSAVFDDISDDMSLQCPNCRAGVTISRSWRVPGPTRTASGDTDPAAGSSYDPSTSQHHLASPEVTRPLDSEEEFLSPMDEQQHISGDAAYPWWPVPDVHASTSSEDQGKPSTESSAQAYHSSVKLSSGKVGLLVDPGSYGNLENRALLDLEKNLLHFMGDGEPTIILPKGPHEGDHHLFIDEAQPSVLPVAVDEAGAGNAIACHATAAELERMRAEEDLCQSVLANFSVDAARQCVCVTLQPRGKNSQSLQHSSVKAPVLVRALAPRTKFSAIAVSADAVCQEHTDKFNSGSNTIIPLRMPAHGGGIWTQLKKGDNIQGEIEVRNVQGKLVAGQNLSLQEGVPLTLDPKVLHATQPWSRGHRVIIIAYCSGSLRKASQVEVNHLCELGFALPVTSVIACPVSAPTTGVPSAESETAQSCQQQPSQEVPEVKGVEAQATSEARPVTSAIASSVGSFVRRVLLITLFQSTVAAFMSNHWVMSAGASLAQFTTSTLMRPEAKSEVQEHAHAQPVDVIAGSLPNSDVNDKVAEAISLHSHAEPNVTQEGFPTEQKIKQRQHVQDMKAQGKEVHVKRKKHVVEQHFDDCGESLSSLTSNRATATSAMFAIDSSSASEDEMSDFAEWATDTVLSSFVQWSMLGSEVALPPELHPKAMLAVDLVEMVSILQSPQFASWGVEIVEICGGEGVTSHLCVKRKLRSGHNFELLTGTDLTVPETQSRVLAYLEIAKPLVVVMAPVCGPFGPLSHRNRIIHREAWEASMRKAVPLAAFCGRIAAFQDDHHRFYLIEQPYPSKLYEVDPWPAIRHRASCHRVIFHQCRVGQRIANLLVKKATELVANAPTLLKPFEGLKCPGDHEHANLLGGNATASGPGDEGEVPVDERWRKCKGCLWRLHKNDPRHTRREGECKHPHASPIAWDCPACKVGKPRSAAGHTFDEKCRFPAIPERASLDGVPAASEPTVDLRASDLGREEEAAAEEAVAKAKVKPRGSRDPAPPDEDDSEGEQDDQEPRAGRGPDQQQRVRRTWGESETQTPDGSDWTSFDVQSSLRALRHADIPGQRRVLRKLHLRWWHAGADRMARMLKGAGIPKATLDLLPSICDTCRVCRLWARPSPDARPSNRLITGFNHEVEGDLMFVRHQGPMQAVFVLTDRGVRWTAALHVPDKKTPTLLNALDQMWVAVFGPMSVFIMDGETGMDDPESTEYFQLRGITKRTAAPRQHTRIVDRKIAVLRDTIHKISSQLSSEGLVVPFVRILSESTFALNALSSVQGCSPYVAVLGRVPSLLPDDTMALSENVSGDMSRHAHRLREIAISAIVAGTAQERIKRALGSHSRAAAVELDYKLGEAVDYFRDPVNKDSSGWRGPATVCDLSRTEFGRIGIRTSTDQVLTCRLQDVRRSIAYWSDELSAFFGEQDLVAPAGSQANYAQQQLQHVDSLAIGTVMTVGQVLSSQEGWLESAAAKALRPMLQACHYLAEIVFHLTNVAAARFANGVRTLTHREGYSGSFTLWWTSTASRSINFLHSKETKLHVASLVGGQEWQHVRMIQLLLVPDEEEWLAARSRAEEEPPMHTPASNAEASSESHGRLSTIPEGTEISAVSLEDIKDLFGETLRPEDVEPLSQAYLACENEKCPSHPEVPGLEQLQERIAQQDLDCHAPTPWAEALQPEALTMFTCAQFDEALAYTSTEVEADYLDADENGAYVALEAYDAWAKCFEGLTRLPNADEHVEWRFYQNHTRKAVIERTDDLLTSQEKIEHAAEVTQAILDELRTWQSFKCFTRRAKKSAPCVIDVKWVLKWKHIKGVRRIRARLCLRGFKETGADDQSNYAATASCYSQRVLASECVLKDWVIASSDVPKAFLQGVSYQELAEVTGKPERDVCFELTGEGLACLQMLPEFSSFNPRTEVLHCLKPGTGCRDAPKSFSVQLRKITKQYGFVCSTVDPELEMLYASEVLIMIILKHVDDLKMAGQKHQIEKFVQHLSGVFGKMEVEYGSFIFCGVLRTQAADGSITMDQIKFLSACKPMMLPPLIAMKPDSPLPEHVRRHFLSLLMTVAYGLLTRPDVSVFIAALQREAHVAKPIHVKRLNTVLKWIQENPRRLTYPKMPYPDTLLQISDSAFKARAEDGLSMRGLVSVRVCMQDVLDGKPETKCHLVDYVSKSQRHVTRSTFSSELFAATDSVDLGLLSSIVLHELKEGVVSTDTARQLIEGTHKSSVGLALVIDARSVSAAVTAPNVRVPAEPSLMLHVCWLRALLAKQRLTHLLWCDTRAMVADAMTKGSAPRDLIQAVMSGRLVMPHKYEDQILA